MRRAKRMLQDLDQEIRDHIEMATQENIDRGMSPTEARYAALRKFGNVTRVKEDVREVWSFIWLEQALQDIRFGVRVLCKSPAFTAVAVLTLALGIGTNTAMFSLVNSVLFRPLPYHAPEQLVWVSDFMPRQHGSYVIESDYYAWLAQNHVFTDVAAYDPADTVTLTNAGEPTRLHTAHITYNFLNVLGAPPRLGRSFREDEDRPGAPHVALLSDQLWRTRFAANPNILGRSLEFDGVLYSVVGILPPSFEFLDNSPADVLTPIALENHEMTMQKGMRIVNVVARLRSGVTSTTAAADIDAINQHLFSTYPPAFANMFQGARAEVIPVRERLLGKSRPALLVLLGAVAFVLLIACANIASLQLARAVSREKEIAIRGALGAGQSRVIRQLLTENALLAFVGGLCGLLLSSWLIHLFLRISPTDVPHLALARLDVRVLLFTFAATCLSGLLFGLAPTFAALRPKLVDSLKETGAQPGATRLGRRSQRALVVAELASALILLTGSGLLLKSFHRLAAIPPGFDANGVFTARISLPPNLYPSNAQQSAFFQQLIAQCSALPGVTSCGVTSGLPLQDSNNGTSVDLEGQAQAPLGLAPLTELARVSPGYFQALRIPLLDGAIFNSSSPQSNANLLVVNQAFSRRFFPGQSPLGHRVLLGKTDYWTIVGVVGDTKQSGLAAPVEPRAFISVAREAFSEMAIVLRSNHAPESLVPAVCSIVSNVDKNLPLYDVLTMQDLLRDQTASQRFTLMLLSAFSALAVLLACLGIYGVTAYAVSQRTREFGLRMALGAQPKNILSLVLRQAAWVSIFGVLIGIAASLSLGKLIASMLFETQPTDPITFVTVSLLLLFVILLACYFPARRASQVDPIVALRYE
jgi:putative ABC transport system permease protein